MFTRYFRTEESKESVLVIPVGNVTAQTELTYEYGVRRKGRRQAEKKTGENSALIPVCVQSRPKCVRITPLKGQNSVILVPILCSLSWW